MFETLILLALFGTLSAGVLGVRRALIKEAAKKSLAEDNRFVQWTRLGDALGLSGGSGRHSWRAIDGEQMLPQLFGIANGVEVYVGMRRLPGRSRHSTFIDCVFDVPLKHGLRLMPTASIIPVITPSRGYFRVWLGGYIDQAYEVLALDVEQTHRLLYSQRTLELLAPHHYYPRARYPPFQTSVTDYRVRLEIAEQCFSAEIIRYGMETCSLLHKEIVKAWNLLPLSNDELYIQQRWRNTAEASGMTYYPRGMIAYDQTSDMSVQIEAIRESDYWHSDFFVNFSPSLGAGLYVIKQYLSSMNVQISNSQDVELGLPEFDQLFVVRARDAGRARELLTEKAQKIIIELYRRLGSIWLSDSVMRFRWLRHIVDGQEMAWVIAQLKELAAELIRHRRVVATGPFR